MANKYNPLKALAALSTAALTTVGAQAAPVDYKALEDCMVNAVVAVEGISGQLQSSTMADPMNGTSVALTGGMLNGKPVIVIKGGGTRLPEVAMYNADAKQFGYSGKAVSGGTTIKLWDTATDGQKYLGTVPREGDPTVPSGMKTTRLANMLKACYAP